MGIALRTFCGCTLLYILTAYRCFQFGTVVPSIDSMTNTSAIASSWMFLLSSHWLTSSRDPPCAKLISTVGKHLYVNALTESERLNDTECRSETCPETELIVVRPERTSWFGPRTHVLYKCFMSLSLIVIQTNIKFLKITVTWTNIW